MKKLFPAALAAIFAIVFTLHAQAQQPFVLSKKGAVAEYEVKGPGGVVMSHTRMTVDAVDLKDERNFTVTMTVEVLNADLKALAEPQTVTTEVKNGIVEVAPNNMGMEIEGETPSYPVDLKVGYTNEYSFKVKAMGTEVVTSGKDKVVARESVTTPAGTFDCFKIETDMTMAVMGQTQNMKNTTWTAHGVGAVKAEVRDSAGSVLSAQTLTSLKQ